MNSINEMAFIFKALSDPLRLKLLKILTKQNKCKEFCVCGLAEELNISQPNVSHHLKILKTAGLIQCNRYEGYSYYVVNKEKINDLLLFLKEEI